MDDQSTFDDWQRDVREEVEEYQGEHDAGLQRRFEEFHASNPDVYAALVRLARRARARGVERWSINGLFEVLRWQLAIETRGDPFRLNNNFRSRYARLIMYREPDLAGFFETRYLRAV